MYNFQLFSEIITGSFLFFLIRSHKV